jgi:23S rRNA (uracil1939-C5)-methyltransferase
VANGIGNTHFYKVNLEQTSRLKKLWETLTKPEIVILDPPRAGLHKNLILTIQELKPKRIVYVACNPTTQARDIASIVESSYTLQHMTMVDMFPHTPHIETVAVLEKAG